MTVDFRKTGNLFYSFFCAYNINKENVSDDGKAQNIFSPHIK